MMNGINPITGAWLIGDNIWPTLDTAIGAISSIPGWDVTSYRVSSPQWYELSNDITPQYILDGLCKSAQATISKRWAQQVSEAYAISVKAVESIDALGELSASMGSSVQSEYDYSAWVNGDNVSVAKADSGTLSAPTAIKEPTGAVLARGDYFFDSKDKLEEKNALVEAMIAEAECEIMKSHRANTVSFDTVLLPVLDRHHTVSVSTSVVSCKGKVRHVVHVLDPDAGSATTSVSIALLLTGATGLPVVPSSKDVPDATPDGPPEETDKTTVITGTWFDVRTATNIDGYSGWIGVTSDSLDMSYEVHDAQFRILAPEISSEDVQDLNGSVSKDITIHLEEDFLQINN
jgi:hypothetical protein